MLIMPTLMVFSMICFNGQDVEKKITCVTTVFILLDVKRHIILIKSQSHHSLYICIVPSAGLHFGGIKIKCPLEVVKADNILI